MLRKKIKDKSSYFTEIHRGSQRVEKHKLEVGSEKAKVEGQKFKVF